MEDLSAWLAKLTGDNTELLEQLTSFQSVFDLDESFFSEKKVAEPDQRCQVKSTVTAIRCPHEFTGIVPMGCKRCDVKNIRVCRRHILTVLERPITCRCCNSDVQVAEPMGNDKDLDPARPWSVIYWPNDCIGREGHYRGGLSMTQLMQQPTAVDDPFEDL